MRHMQSDPPRKMAGHIIGLTGPSGSGKDVVADYLVDAYGFVKRSFADPIYDALSEVSDVPVPDLHRAKRGERLTIPAAKLEEGFGSMVNPHRAKSLTVREALVAIGNVMRAMRGPSVFIELFDEFILKRINDVTAGRAADVRIVNPSVRYTCDGMAAERNYFYELRNAGAKACVWHVWRYAYPVEVSWGKDATDRPLNFHTGDSLIINSSDVDRLHTAVSLLLSGNAIVNSSDYDAPSER